VDAISPDWNEQAVKSAESYLETSSFSRSSLIEQLKFEASRPSRPSTACRKRIETGPASF